MRSIILNIFKKVMVFNVVFLVKFAFIAINSNENPLSFANISQKKKKMKIIIKINIYDENQ